jgi:3-oxoacyl-[acyl-carrier-protein] synthase II
MSSSRRRVVITGLGLATPIGQGTDAFWNSLERDHSGVRRIQAFDTSALPTQFGGEVPGFDPKDYLDKKERKHLKMMVRSIQLAVAGAKLAVEDAHIDKEQIDAARFGVELGSAVIPGELGELAAAARVSANGRAVVDLEKWGEVGIPLIPPTWMLNHVPNMMACHVSILHNAQGPNNTITQSDVASLLALGEAYRIIGRDRADIILTGGADTKIIPISLVRHCLFGELSRRNDAPEKACRPFERSRDGQVLGEGAAVFVIEELEHARRRGAPIYAELVGFGTAFDRRCSGRGLARAIRTAMVDAGVGALDIDHVNAHGVSTCEGDAWEARAINEVFGDRRPAMPVFAPKSYFGDLGAGSATAELAASLLALERGRIPPTLNHEESDPACPISVTKTAQPVTRPYVLKISLTEMGQCAVIVCKKWSGDSR